MTDLEERAEPEPRDPRVTAGPSSPADGRPGRRARTRRRHPVLTVIVSTLVALALVLGMSVAYFYRHLNGNLNRKDITGDIVGTRPTMPADVGPKGPINILIIGTDTRDCPGCDIDGLNGEGGADTTMVLHLSADRKSAYGVSIPRDSLVDRPACRDKVDRSVIHPAATQQMWNVAYAIGGAACTQAQVEHTTGIRIDHFVTVNFGSFKNMVDAVGGVKVCVPETWSDPAHGIYLRKGTRKIRGRQALAYVRERYVAGVSGSDIGRIKRQQAFIGALVSQVLSADTLAHPIRLGSFLNAATKSLTLDMNLTQLGKLAFQFKGVGSSGIQFITVPWEAPAFDRNRVVWKPEATQVWQSLLHDRPLPAELTTDAIDVDHLPGQSASPSPSSSPSTSPSTSPTGTASPTTSPSPVLEANGRTHEENQALEDAGLCT